MRRLGRVDECLLRRSDGEAKENYLKKLVRSRLARTLLVSVGALGLLMDGPASAHYIYDWAITGSSGQFCVRGRSEISHGGGGGYSRGDVETRTADPTWTNCAWRPYYYSFQHGLMLQVEHWAPGMADWQTCLVSGFAVRTGDAAASYLDWNYNLPCGEGQYYTWTWAGARATDADSWHGGWVSSGNSHWLPA